MIIRFGFRNHRSFAEAAELSFVASALGDEGVNLLASPGLSKSLLPGILVYGANASGKSNIVSALDFMKNSVLLSHRVSGPNSRVPRSPFSLAEKPPATTSEFNIDFVIENVRYHYGFECDDTSFTSEWLYAFPNGRRQVLFERTDGGRKFAFGREMKGPTRVIESITRPNSLFVSSGAQNNHETLSLVYQFFERLVIIKDFIPDTPALFANEDSFDKRIVDFLRVADGGIVSHALNEIKSQPDDSRAFIKDIEDVIKKHVKFDGDDDALSNFSFNRPDTFRELRLGHQSLGGEVIYMPFDTESRGTRRVVSLLGPIFSALDSGLTVVVDELDASLHTFIVMEIVRLFSNKIYNRKQAQLLATTHDTNVLSQRAIRRDQVWLTEKTDRGISTVYPLTDFRTKKNDNIERGYLRGRYGGVPTKLHT